MKTKKKLGLRIRTIRDLDRVTGGARGGFRGELDERLAEIRKGLGGTLGKESDEHTCTTDTTSNDNHCPCSRRREETCPPPTVFEGVLNRFTR
jgi:hypothetical protein